MAPTTESVLDAAMRLPPEERLLLIAQLLESVPPESLTLGMDDAELEAELDRRFSDQQGAVPWRELRTEP